MPRKTINSVKEDVQEFVQVTLCSKYENYNCIFLDKKHVNFKKGKAFVTAKTAEELKKLGYVK